jgi:short-subunit dehydrogenase
VRRRILISGASSGIGEGMARQFASRGHDLALCARRVDRLEALHDQLTSQYPQSTVAIRELDVTRPDDVHAVFTSFADALDGLDRVIVNAGLGKGAAIGTGHPRANAQTATTNVLGALAQCETAMEIFRAAGCGHLVVISSVSSVRGCRGAMTTYAATKSFVASLAEGIRSDVMGTDIVVSTIRPGYIASEMTARADRTVFMVDTETGCRAIVDAIERERSDMVVPRWPWRPMAAAFSVLPLRVVRRLM